MSSDAVLALKQFLKGSSFDVDREDLTRALSFRTSGGVYYGQLQTEQVNEQAHINMDANPDDFGFGFAIMKARLFAQETLNLPEIREITGRPRLPETGMHMDEMIKIYDQLQDVATERGYDNMEAFMVDLLGEDSSVPAARFSNFMEAYSDFSSSQRNLAAADQALVLGAHRAIRTLSDAHELGQRRYDTEKTSRYYIPEIKIPDLPLDARGKPNITWSDSFLNASQSMLSYLERKSSEDVDTDISKTEGYAVLRWQSNDEIDNDDQAFMATNSSIIEEIFTTRNNTFHEEQQYQALNEMLDEVADYASRNGLEFNRDHPNAVYSEDFISVIRAMDVAGKMPEFMRAHGTITDDRFEVIEGVHVVPPTALDRHLVNSGTYYNSIRAMRHEAYTYATENNLGIELSNDQRLMDVFDSGSGYNRIFEAMRENGDLKGFMEKHSLVLSDEPAYSSGLNPDVFGTVQTFLTSDASPAALIAVTELKTAMLTTPQAFNLRSYPGQVVNDLALDNSTDSVNFVSAFTQSMATSRTLVLDVASRNAGFMAHLASETGMNETEILGLGASDVIDADGITLMRAAASYPQFSSLPMTLRGETAPENSSLNEIQGARRAFIANAALMTDEQILNVPQQALQFYINSLDVLAGEDQATRVRENFDINANGVSVDLAQYHYIANETAQQYAVDNKRDVHWSLDGALVAKRNVYTGTEMREADDPIRIRLIRELSKYPSFADISQSNYVEKMEELKAINDKFTPTGHVTKDPNDPTNILFEYMMAKQDTGSRAYGNGSQDHFYNNETPYGALTDMHNALSMLNSDQRFALHSNLIEVQAANTSHLAANLQEFIQDNARGIERETRSLGLASITDIERDDVDILNPDFLRNLHRTIRAYQETMNINAPEPGFMDRDTYRELGAALNTSEEYAFFSYYRQLAPAHHIIDAHMRVAVAEGNTEPRELLDPMGAYLTAVTGVDTNSAARTVTPTGAPQATPSPTTTPDRADTDTRPDASPAAGSGVTAIDIPGTDAEEETPDVSDASEPANGYVFSALLAEMSQKPVIGENITYTFNEENPPQYNSPETVQAYQNMIQNTVDWLDDEGVMLRATLRPQSAASLLAFENLRQKFFENIAQTIAEEEDLAPDSDVVTQAVEIGKLNIEIAKLQAIMAEGQLLLGDALEGQFLSLREAVQWGAISLEEAVEDGLITQGQADAVVPADENSEGNYDSIPASDIDAMTLSERLSSLDQKLDVYLAAQTGPAKSQVTSLFYSAEKGFLVPSIFNSNIDENSELRIQLESLLMREDLPTLFRSAFGPVSQLTLLQRSQSLEEISSAMIETGDGTLSEPELDTLRNVMVLLSSFNALDNKDAFNFVPSASTGAPTVTPITPETVPGDTQPTGRPTETPVGETAPPAPNTSGLTAEVQQRMRELERAFGEPETGGLPTDALREKLATYMIDLTNRDYKVEFASTVPFNGKYFTLGEDGEIFEALDKSGARALDENGNPKAAVANIRDIGSPTDKPHGFVLHVLQHALTPDNTAEELFDEKSNLLITRQLRALDKVTGSRSGPNGSEELYKQLTEMDPKDRKAFFKEKFKDQPEVDTVWATFVSSQIHLDRYLDDPNAMEMMTHFNRYLDYHRLAGLHDIVKFFETGQFTNTLRQERILDVDTSMDNEIMINDRYFDSRVYEALDRGLPVDKFLITGNEADRHIMLDRQDVAEIAMEIFEQQIAELEIADGDVTKAIFEGRLNPYFDDLKLVYEGQGKPPGWDKSLNELDRIVQDPEAHGYSIVQLADLEKMRDFVQDEFEDNKAWLRSRTFSEELRNEIFGGQRSPEGRLPDYTHYSPALLDELIDSAQMRADRNIPDGDVSKLRDVRDSMDGFLQGRFQAMRAEPINEALLFGFMNGHRNDAWNARFGDLRSLGNGVDTIINGETRDPQFSAEDIGLRMMMRFRGHQFLNAYGLNSETLNGMTPEARGNLAQFTSRGWVVNPDLTYNEFKKYLETADIDASVKAGFDQDLGEYLDGQSAFSYFNLRSMNSSDNFNMNADYMKLRTDRFYPAEVSRQNNVQLRGSEFEELYGDDAQFDERKVDDSRPDKIAQIQSTGDELTALPPHMQPDGPLEPSQTPGIGLGRTA